MSSGRRWASDRRRRLPPGWSSTIVPRILARDRGICWICGGPGADSVDHKQRGDDHSDANLAAAHLNVAPYCHRYKSSAEGVAAREHANRRPEKHPGLD